MKPAAENPCETIRPLIVGLLDRELNESEVQLVNEHLIRCEDCRNEYDRLSETQAPLARVSFTEPTDEVLNRLWKKPYDRVAWLTGLWLSLGGGVLVLGYALWEFIANFEFDAFFSGDDPALPRIGFAAVCAGLVLLLIQTIRNRIKTYRVDPYKHVKR